jgi:hypothetical protein
MDGGLGNRSHGDHRSFGVRFQAPSGKFGAIVIGTCRSGRLDRHHSPATKAAHSRQNDLQPSGWHDSATAPSGPHRSRPRRSSGVVQRDCRFYVRRLAALGRRRAHRYTAPAGLARLRRIYRPPAIQSAAGEPRCRERPARRVSRAASGPSPCRCRRRPGRGRHGGGAGRAILDHDPIKLNRTMV